MASASISISSPHEHIYELHYSSMVDKIIYKHGFHNMKIDYGNKTTYMSNMIVEHHTKHGKYYHNTLAHIQETDCNSDDITEERYHTHINTPQTPHNSASADGHTCDVLLC